MNPQLEALSTRFPGVTFYGPPYAIVYPGVIIGEGTRIGEDVRIGHNCVIGRNCRILYSVKFSKDVTVEDNVFIGPGTLFSNDKYPPTKISRGATIKENAVIGIGCIFNPDIVIGEGAVVGAGTHLIKDVPPHKVVVTKHTYHEICTREEYDEKQLNWVNQK